MRVCDIISKKPIFSESNESIAKALEKMQKYKIHQLPILKNGKFIGMVFLKRFFKKTFFPEETKIEKFVEVVPTLGMKDNLEKAFELIVKAGTRALPVLENSKLVGIVSETDLIKHVKIGNEIYPQDFEKKVITANINDSLGKIIGLMRRNDISRVVIEEGEKIVGCVDNLELIKILKVPKESQTFSKISKEKISLKNIPIKGFIRDKIFILEKSEFSLEKILEILQKFSEIILTENGRPIGLITPKDILKFSLPKISGRIVVSGYDLEIFEFYTLNRILENFFQKMSNIFEINEMKVNVKAYSTLGKKKYSLRGRVQTSENVFNAKSYGWKITDAAYKLIKRLRKIMIKKKEKI